MSTPTITPTSSTAQELPPITAQGCDHCGYSDDGRDYIAQAFVRATLKSGLTLLFCGHHADVHMPKLVQDGAEIQDEREKINVKPSVSANSI